MTYTYAILELRKPTVDEISDKLRVAGYDHAFHDGVVDMHGIALRPLEPTADQRATPNLEDIERTAWASKNSTFVPAYDADQTLALVERIRRLDEALNAALAHVPAGEERDRLVAVLAGR